MLEQGKSVKTSSPEKVIGREEEQEICSKVRPGKKWSVDGRCFNIWFYFLLAYSVLIDNKLN